MKKNNSPSQAVKLFKLLTMKKYQKGLTSVEIQELLPSTCAHKRFSELLKSGYPVMKVVEQRGSCRKVYKAKKEAFYG